MIEPAPGRPLWGNCLIRKEATAKKTKQGIYLPENTQDTRHAHHGTIIAIGSGSLAFDGSPIEIESGLKPGVEVIYLDFEAHEVEIAKEILYLVDQRNIIYVF